MTAHAENTLRCPCITQILYLSLAVSASKAGGAKGLVTSQNRQVFDLVAARAAAISAVVADEGAIAEEEEICIGVEEGTTGIATEAVEMPSIAGWPEMIWSVLRWTFKALYTYSKSSQRTKLKGLALLKNLITESKASQSTRLLQSQASSVVTSPHPLQGKTSSSMGLSR